MLIELPGGRMVNLSQITHVLPPGKSVLSDGTVIYMVDETFLNFTGADAAEAYKILRAHMAPRPGAVAGMLSGFEDYSRRLSRLERTIEDESMNDRFVEIERRLTEIEGAMEEDEPIDDLGEAVDEPWTPKIGDRVRHKPSGECGVVLETITPTNPILKPFADVQYDRTGKRYAEFDHLEPATCDQLAVVSCDPKAVQFVTISWPGGSQEFRAVEPASSDEDRARDKHKIADLWQLIDEARELLIMSRGRMPKWHRDGCRCGLCEEFLRIQDFLKRTDEGDPVFPESDESADFVPADVYADDHGERYHE